MKKRRRKLKKEVYYILIGIVIFIILIIIGINKIKEYKYHQTSEYHLLEKGYSEEETKEILTFGKEKIEYFLNNEKNTQIISLINEKYYLDKNFDKYIEYLKENPNLETNIIVRNINIHLNYDFYEQTYHANMDLDTSILVNKYYYLKSDYIPDDLVTISQTYSWGENGSQKTRQVVYDAFIDMWNSANKEGYYLMINSSFRNYQDQESVYNNYKNTSGQTYADSIATRPGFSEHQTGLALDIFSKNNTNKNTFKDSEEANWLKENAYKFGFILRYPEEFENITGITYEAWHYRYVGKDIAKYIYENNITFDEYYAYFLED